MGLIFNLPSRFIRSVTEKRSRVNILECNHSVMKVPDPDMFLSLDKNLIISGDIDVSYQAVKRL